MMPVSFAVCLSLPYRQTKTAVFVSMLSFFLIGLAVCLVGCTNHVVSVSTTDVTCPNCNGIGRYGTCLTCANRSAIVRQTCAPCSSTGTFLCGFCNGRGTIPPDTVSHVKAQMAERERKIQAELKEQKQRAEQERQREEQRRQEEEQRRQARFAEEQRALAAERIAQEAQERRLQEQRERQREQQRIVAEQRAREEQERQRIATERRQKWREVFDKIEKDMVVHDVVTLVDEGLGIEGDVRFLGTKTSTRPIGSRNDTLEWRTRDNALRIRVTLSRGRVFEIEETGLTLE